MHTKRDLDRYLDAVVQEGLYRNRDNLEFQLHSLFGKIDFLNRAVLDVGGGSGLYSFYAALMGAARVVCLEPGSHGSSSGAINKFNTMKRTLDISNVVLMPITLQSLSTTNGTFDIILLHNSINHLDETACINLLTHPASRAIYKDIFLKLYALANDGAVLIICDCSRHNFFARLQIRNPFAPTIEWHKHQSPEVWEKLLREVGFAYPHISWSSFNTLRRCGKILTGNRLISYFLISHFCLTMHKT